MNYMWCPSHLQRIRPLNFLKQCIRIRHLHKTIPLYQPAAYNNTASMLLQKNLLLRNNTLYGYGYGTIRCTVFDSQGNTGPSSIEMKREDLVTRHKLLPRDLRKIEKSKKNDLVPSILVRKDGILISLLTIKALIKSDSVIIFDSVGSGISLSSTSQRDFIQNLKLRLKNEASDEVNSQTLPYEFRALEAIFVFALSNLTSEMKVLLTLTQGVLTDLDHNITRDKLRLLLIQNKKLKVFYKKCVLVRDMLDDLLEQDDMLCDMYLTDWKEGIVRIEDDHSEIEMLLETYHNHVDEVVQRTENIISNVRTTEEIINIILDSNRNQLMLLNIKMGVGMFSLGGAIFVGSLYGMNLENFIEETDYGFAVATGVGLLSTVWFYWFCMRSLHRLQRMSLLNSLKVKKKD
ncbi:similar to Saccharomyces cerevisiae YPL060W MFM1 Mitochondrial inner membrane magnesium transporter [Maudiozyma saulgeensis]|uniref:Magnesium transporter n=1 Tax=Maudiozyma saulgeensis TaxID=1789683 RepID=A0A1X7R6F1_9SACH|nr:similar to Saccharomyces cerevisiae YPL060W MFM1 Mitochondrial inner membrane magnesium transporter [Kazachstania saulgeensis]